MEGSSFAKNERVNCIHCIPALRNFKLFYFFFWNTSSDQLSSVCSNCCRESSESSSSEEEEEESGGLWLDRFRRDKAKNAAERREAWTEESSVKGDTEAVPPTHTTSAPANPSASVERDAQAQGKTNRKQNVQTSAKEAVAEANKEVGTIVKSPTETESKPVSDRVRQKIADMWVPLFGF